MRLYGVGVSTGESDTMSRKETIQSLAREHANRGIYDNAICKTGLEKVTYAKVWESNRDTFRPM